MSLIERVFYGRICETAIITILFLVILVGVIYAVKHKYFPKWSIPICLAGALVVAGLWLSVYNIHLDIKEEAYVTYEGVYARRGGGMRDLKTIAVYDAEGREIRLFCSGYGWVEENGEYDGKVVYGKRSKIVAEYDGTLIE